MRGLVECERSPRCYEVCVWLGVRGVPLERAWDTNLVSPASPARRASTVHVVLLSVRVAVGNGRRNE